MAKRPEDKKLVEDLTQRYVKAEGDNVTLTKDELGRLLFHMEMYDYSENDMQVLRNLYWATKRGLAGALAAEEREARGVSEGER